MKRIFKKFYKQYHEYFLPFLGGLGIILLSLYVLIPQIRTIIELIQLTSEKDDQLKILVTKRELLDSVSAGSTQTFLSDAELALPREKDAASILIALENLSAQSKFTVDSVSFTPGLVSTESGNLPQPKDTSAKQNSAKKAPEKSAHGAPTLAVAVKGKGETAQFAEFLKLIYKVRRIFDIGEIRLAYTADEPDFLSAELNLQTYYLPPITEIGAIDTELPRISATEQKILSDLASFPVVSKSISIPTGETGTELLPQVGKKDLFTP